MARPSPDFQESSQLARPSALDWYIRMTEAIAAPPISTREQIIQAAADSLLEQGYSGTSVRAIVKRVGAVSVAATAIAVQTANWLKRAARRFSFSLV